MEFSAPILNLVGTGQPWPAARNAYAPLVNGIRLFIFFRLARYQSRIDLHSQGQIRTKKRSIANGHCQFGEIVMDMLPDFGKYAFTVWTCYGVSLALLLALTIHTLVQKAKYKNGR